MALVITGACLDVKDGICTTSCPVSCIYEGERMYYIHPTECIECGMCESICPVDAIRFDDEVEPEDEKFILLNAAPFMRADGSIEQLGGWSRGSDPIKDPKAVSELPHNSESEK